MNLNIHLLGQVGTDANEPAGYLPGQVATSAKNWGNREAATDEIFGMVEKTLRRVAAPTSTQQAAPFVISKKDNRYTGKRHFLWKSRETGLKLWVWPERGFVHIERDDGQYKKWTRRDALGLMTAFGLQSESSPWADERLNARNAYLTLRDVCLTARDQGDPTLMTPEEERALRESMACAVLPGYGPIAPPTKVTFVGSKIVKEEPA